MTIDAGLLIYAGILGAAMIEGEIAYVAAAALVAEGRLNPLGVVLAGATGAALGDQFYFYLLRRRVACWLRRFPRISRRAQPLIHIVRRHQAGTIFLIRFAPGLRIALAAACAYVNVRPILFSSVNAAAALVWAVVLLGIVGYAGPAYLSRIGLSGWQAAVLTGLLIVVALHLVGRLERRHISSSN